MVDSAAGILDREAQIGLDLYWRIRRFAYSGDDVEYIGCNKNQKAATSADTWAIWKYTYSGGDVSVIEGPITGIWDNRSSLDWN